jgi:hypothetical protein
MGREVMISVRYSLSFRRDRQAAAPAVNGQKPRSSSATPSAKERRKACSGELL